jgi:hypothetical protein
MDYEPAIVTGSGRAWRGVVRQRWSWGGGAIPAHAVTRVHATCTMHTGAVVEKAVREEIEEWHGGGSARHQQIDRGGG